MRDINPTVLAVDDCEFDRDLMARAFKQIGVTTPIQFLSGGFEAIEYLQGAGKYGDRVKYGFPSFIMTDLNMEEGDGFDVLEFVQAQAGRLVVPVVVFSASMDSDDIKRAFLLGASAYHVKPNSYKALVHQLLLLHAYWGSTEMPDSDSGGALARTVSHGKLGARFATNEASIL